MTDVAYALSTIRKPRSRVPSRNTPKGLIRMPGQCNYAIPIDAAKQAIETHMHLFHRNATVLASSRPESDHRHSKIAPAPKDGLGWQQTACRTASTILGRSPAAVERRLRAILNDTERDRGRAADAALVDAVFLTVGLRLDHDVPLPVLPCTTPLALDLLQIRNEIHGSPHTEQEIRDMVRPLLVLCTEILDRGDWSDEMLSQAPLDCLRPIERS